MRVPSRPVVIRLVLVLALLATILTAPATAQPDDPPDAPSDAQPDAPSEDAGTPEVTLLDPLPGAVISPGDLPVRLAVRTSDPTVVTVNVDGLEESRLRFTAPVDRMVEVMVHVEEGRRTVTVYVDGALVQAIPILVGDPQVIRRVTDSLPVATAIELARRQTTGDATPRDGATPASGPAASAVLVGQAAVPDALAAIPLAAHLGAPLLVTTSDALPEATATALTDLVEPGGQVLILGGDAVIGARVLDDVAALGFVPSRTAGADRTETAALIAELLPRSRKAFLVAGAIGVDAVAVSALAAAERTPILLTTPDELPGITGQELSRRGTEQVIIVGGPAVVAERVSAATADLGLTVERLAGPDRITTSVMTALLAPRPIAGVSLVTTADPLTALLAANDSARDGRPLVFLDGGQVTASLRAFLPQLDPGPVVVYGTGIDAATVRTVDRLLADVGPVATVLAPATASAQEGIGLPPVAATADRLLDPAASRLSLLVDGQGVPLPLSIDPSGTTVTGDTSGLPLEPGWWGGLPVRVVGLLVGVDGSERFLEWTWRFTPATSTYAVVAVPDGPPLALAAPSAVVQVIGYHQASSDGALAQTAAGSVPASVVMPSRGRGTERTSAADVVVDPAFPLMAPVSGTVTIAQEYLLYCQHVDERLTIRPDDHPGLEVTLLHVTGLRVAEGDHVEAGRTLVADGARALPFESQVDRYTDERRWPHTHVQVVDPTLVTRPAPTC